MFMAKDMLVKWWWRGSDNQAQQQQHLSSPAYQSIYSESGDNNNNSNGEFYGGGTAEEVQIDADYFYKLEVTHGLKMGELSTFYFRVNDWYPFQIMSCYGKPTEFIALFDAFINRYLFHLYMYPEELSFNTPWVITDVDSQSSTIIDISSPSASRADDASVVDELGSETAAATGSSSIDPSLDFITYPCMYYEPPYNDAEPHCLPLDGDECQTYMVSARLDLVYSTIYESALVDILYRRNVQMWNAGGISLCEDQLNMLAEHARYYREQMTYTYKGSGSEAATPTYPYQPQHQPPVNQTTDEFGYAASETVSTTAASSTTTNNNHNGAPLYDQRRQSHEMVIYTKRSSAFYRRCCEILYGPENSNLMVAFSPETARTATIPFQQVMLMCGQQPGFIKRHCQPEAASSTTTDTLEIVNVARSVASDWVVVPVWHYLLYEKIVAASK